MMIWRPIERIHNCAKRSLDYGACSLSLASKRRQALFRHWNKRYSLILSSIVCPLLKKLCGANIIRLLEIIMFVTIVCVCVDYYN